MRINLNDDEVERIERYRQALLNKRQQIQNLIAQGDEMADIINTSWKAAHQRVQLEDKEFAERLNGDSVPPMINTMGTQVVRLDAKKKTADWDTVHDAKRVANSGEEKPEPEEVSEPDESTDVETSEEEPNTSEEEENATE